MNIRTMPIAPPQMLRKLPPAFRHRELMLSVMKADAIKRQAARPTPTERAKGRARLQALIDEDTRYRARAKRKKTKP